MAERDRRVRTALYPGTFDPIHNGHLDVIGRAARLVDRLVIGVAANVGKSPMFSLEERLDLARREAAVIAARSGCIVEVDSFDSLLITFAHEVGAGMIAGMNARLDQTIETVFLPASERQHFISSRFVKEIALLGGDISSFVPPLTLERVLARVRVS
jgi:pantetheine-phosphate adenylyltransferase